jgi:hypothetical protein
VASVKKVDSEEKVDLGREVSEGTDLQGGIRVNEGKGPLHQVNSGNVVATDRKVEEVEVDLVEEEVEGVAVDEEDLTDLGSGTLTDTVAVTRLPVA